MKGDTAQDCPIWWDPDQLWGHHHSPAEGRSSTAPIHTRVAACKEAETNAYGCPLAMLCPDLPTFKADVILISTIAHKL